MSRYAFVSALLFSAFTVSAFAQSCDPTPPDAGADTVRVVREPEALKILRSSLVALGGVEAWSGVRSVRITFTVAATKYNPAAEYTSLEDFSRDNRPRALRTDKSGDTARTMVADEEREPKAATIAGKSLPVQPVPALELIATENPAIVIAAALKSERISVCALRNMGDPAHPGEDLTWIRLSRTSKLGSRAVAEIGIAKESSLPVRVRRRLPSYSLYAPPTWEEAAFSEFQKRASLLIPNAVFVRGVNGAVRQVTVQQVEIDPAVPEAEFQGGAR